MSYLYVIKELRKQANADRITKTSRFFKTGKGEYGEGDKFLGVSVPDQRKIGKRYKHLDLTEVQFLIENEYHEVRHTAIFILLYKIHRCDTQTLEEVVQFYLKNLFFINNWDLVDSSSTAILGRYLHQKEKGVLYDLAKSNNIWERRIAIVSCKYFIKEGEFEDTFKIALILLSDPEDLIQKAVGWMLKEVGEMNPEAEMDFLNENSRYKVMPRTMLRYSISKFDEPLIRAYLNGEV